VAVRKLGAVFEVFGTPWAGEAGIAVNEKANLDGIFFLSHGGDNFIEPMSRAEAFENLLPVTSIPWFDREVMDEILGFCEGLVSRVPAYRLCFRPDKDAAYFFEGFIAGR
jgi:hypothetical protein